MIITCPNCNKKFNIDEKLIPKNGRLLQCSSCNHKWHYSIIKEENEIVENVNLIEKNNNNSNSNDNIIPSRPSSNEKNNNKKKINKINKSIKIPDIKNKNINKNISLRNIFNNLIIIIITFVALILILDTFKNNISNYLPILIPFLDNLYLSTLDLISFLKDLFN